MCVGGGCGKRLDKDLICMYAVLMDVDSGVARAWDGVGSGWSGAMLGKKRDICNNLNNKDLFLKSRE